jgi:hypothetical protein
VVKQIRNISVFILSAIFLVSATGILIFHSHCACTGNDQFTVYVTPETCTENFHVHHIHNEGGEEVCSSEYECHECNDHSDDCGCDSPDVQFFKLDNQVISEKIRTEKMRPAQINMLKVITLLPIVLSEIMPVKEYFYFDPPPIVQSSTHFLISIHQLKIPDVA